MYRLIALFCFSYLLAQFDEKIKTADQTIQLFMEAKHAPGLVIAIGIKDKVIWSKGYGYADMEQSVPMDPKLTKLRIGSVAKPITAVMIGQLYEQGKLDLDRDIRDYVPSFPKKAKGTITSRLLAGHLAGIRHYRGDEFMSRTHYPTVMEGLTIFKDDTLLHEVGSKYQYSSYGWNLISAVLESASGEKFLDYMQENVFKKMGMSETVPDYLKPIIPHRGRYYVIENGVIVNEPEVDNSYKWAGGGFLSTAEDLIKFGFAHLYHRILKKETIDIMWTPQKTNDGKTTNYGIGWNISDRNGLRIIAHSGGSVGGSTYFIIIPERELVIAMISNTSSLGYGDLRPQLMDIFTN